MSSRERVYIVDDDPIVLGSMRMLLENRGYALACYESAETFLSALTTNVSGCLIMDLRMPSMEGDDLQRLVIAKYPLLSVVVVTGVADVPTAVRVMEEGAVTLLEKPYQPEALVAAVERALSRSATLSAESARIAAIRERMSSLTEDERQVMKYMVQGLSNKRVALALNISLRTLDRRRAAVMAKMQVASAPELAALLERARVPNPD